MYIYIYIYLDIIIHTTLELQALTSKSKQLETSGAQGVASASAPLRQDAARTVPEFGFGGVAGVWGPVPPAEIYFRSYNSGLCRDIWDIRRLVALLGGQCNKDPCVSLRSVFWGPPFTYIAWLLPHW